MSMDQFPGKLRSLFPITEKFVYLNHASAGPLSRLTRDCMVNVLDRAMYLGPHAFEDLEQMQLTAQQRAAQLVNAKTHQIAFLRNTSDAVSAIANGVSWRRGDNFVTAAGEFPANVYPWLRVAAEFEVETRITKPGDRGLISVDELLGLVDDRTRVVSVSWVEFATGQRLDIQRIGKFCRERGILFFVDAIQGLGALQLDVERDYIDAFAAGAQKFLLGPKGVALLYLSDGALEMVRPTALGWTAVKEYADYLVRDIDLRKGAARFDGGTPNVVGICGLGESIDLLLTTGPARIEQYLLSLNRYLAQGLQDRGYRVTSSQKPSELSAIVTCQHDRYPAQEICSRLEAHNIVTCTRNDVVRIAPHFYNTQSDLDALLTALPE
jgi:cysteine desulfurase/selenocysteine lyase